MRLKTIVPGAVLKVLMLVGPAAAAPVAAAPPEPAPAAVSSPAAANSSEYRIGTDDVLDITVFQVPELTRTVQVDTTGEFTLPIVGRVHAQGKTTDELSAQLTQQLQGRYLKDPLITVVVKTAAKNRVTVDGAVVKPGVYPLSGPTTLMQAIALANGPDPKVANMKKVQVFHETADGHRAEKTYDLIGIRDGKAIDPQVYADDIVVVEASGTRSFFSYYGNLIPLLALLRP
jgi:polysaccharide export outer membrane protein